MAQIASPTITAPAAPISPITTSLSQPRKPATSHHQSNTDSIIPLDSPLRTTPLHASLLTLRLPSTHPTTNLNPITLQPFTDADLKALGYEKLRSDFQDHAGNIRQNEVEKAKEEAVRMLREKMADREAREREVEREVDEKEKIREVERKVYRKKMGDKGKDVG